MSDWRVWGSSTPVARKEHECSECSVPIVPGQKYERFQGNWEGEWVTIKTCLPCVTKRALSGYEDDE